MKPLNQVTRSNMLLSVRIIRALLATGRLTPKYAKRALKRINKVVQGHKQSVKLFTPFELAFMAARPAKVAA